MKLTSDVHVNTDGIATVLRAGTELTAEEAEAYGITNPRCFEDRSVSDVAVGAHRPNPLVVGNATAAADSGSEADTSDSDSEPDGKGSDDGKGSEADTSDSDSDDGKDGGNDADGPTADDVPTGAKDAIAWIDGDLARAKLVLDVEKAGSVRSTVIDAADAVLAAADEA